MMRPESRDMDDRIDKSFPVALEFAAAVHGHGGPDDIEALFATADIPALCVCLAALVDIDRPVSELLKWTVAQHAPVYVIPVDEAVRAAHREHNRLVAAGVPKDSFPAAVIEGERKYQRERYAQRRLRALGYRHPAVEAESDREDKTA